MTTLNKKAVLSSPVGLLAVWFGSGLAKFAPGTFGTLAAMPFAWALHQYTGIIGLLIAAVIVSVIGVPICSAYMKKFDREHDPKEVVIDEVAGVWFTIIFLSAFPGFFTMNIPMLWIYILAFILFRFFDILKPWPISWVDNKVGGGLGVMLDDILAAAMVSLVWAVGWIAWFVYHLGPAN